VLDAPLQTRALHTVSKVEWSSRGTRRHGWVSAARDRGRAPAHGWHTQGRRRERGGRLGAGRRQPEVCQGWHTARCLPALPVTTPQEDAPFTNAPEAVVLRTTAARQGCCAVATASRSSSGASLPPSAATSHGAGARRGAEWAVKAPVGALGEKWGNKRFREATSWVVINLDTFRAAPPQDFCTSHKLPPHHLQTGTASSKKNPERENASASAIRATPAAAAARVQLSIAHT
jgi:hypothetical protein